MDFLNNTFDNVYMSIKRWTPKYNYENESGYRDDLINFLRTDLNRSSWLGSTSHIIRKESGRHLADIDIDRKIGIELKLNLKKKSQADRLIGQVKGFLKDYDGVLIVLCGETDPDQLAYLNDLLSEYSRPLLFQEKLVKVINKSNNATKNNEDYPLF